MSDIEGIAVLVVFILTMFAVFVPLVLREEREPDQHRVDAARERAAREADRLRREEGREAVLNNLHAAQTPSHAAVHRPARSLFSRGAWAIPIPSEAPTQSKSPADMPTLLRQELAEKEASIASNNAEIARLNEEIEMKTALLSRQDALIAS